MDFDRFDSVSKAEDGFEYHVLCAGTGRPLFDNDDDPYKDNGKPCLVIMKGREAASVRAAMHEAKKARALEVRGQEEDGGGDESKDVDFDEVHDILVKAGCAVITGFKNVNRAGKPARAKDADWFLNLNRFVGPSDHKSFVEQIASAANDRARVLGNVSTG
ncbi:hypothetical protein [Thiosulfatihalobacter marinus]|uniref:hypothetical protein n=1 Tax=Thiosulfatihalobacter marinus TaxID=2792481 RepID=UPI0018D9A1C1|nr:hypothetical protein [Thiosulfatihalobacter marinus]